MSKVSLVFTPKLEGRIDFLDVLRACAILPVMLGHQNTPRYPGGPLGVYIFFCLSGYLITKFLIEHEVKYKQGLFAFWIRRFFRIYPMYVFAVLVSLILLFQKKPEDGALVESILLPIFSFWKLPPANEQFFYYSYGVLWTLHIELWFYFLFAPFIVFFNRLRAPSELGIAIFCLFCFILSLTISVVPPALKEQIPSLVSFAKFAKYLIIGSITAVFKQKRVFENLSTTTNKIFVGSAVLLIVVMFVIGKVHRSPNWFEYAFLVGIGTGFLILSFLQLGLRPKNLESWQFPPARNLPRTDDLKSSDIRDIARSMIDLSPKTLARWKYQLSVFFGYLFSLPILAWTGRVSYSLYLVHAMILDFAPNPVRSNLFLFLSACFGVAWLTYLFIELPGIRLGRYIEAKILLKTKDRYLSSASNCTVESSA